MIFKFPQRKIVLDCFTFLSHAVELAPIHYAIKHMPDWWKKLPTSTNPPKPEMKNMRSCVGMVDYYKKSVAIPLWSDLKIEVNDHKDFRWQFSDGNSGAESHVKDQMRGFLEGYGHLKLNTPWVFQSEKNVHWVWSHPTYNYSYGTDLVCLPGITEFFYQNNTNVNLLVKLEQPKNLYIPHGQPLAVLTPMSNRKVEIVRHLIGYEEFAKIRNRGAQITFLDKYKNVMKRKEQFADCPYHKES